MNACTLCPTGSYGPSGRGSCDQCAGGKASLKLAKRVAPIVRLANFHPLGRLRARLVKRVSIRRPGIRVLILPSWNLLLCRKRLVLELHSNKYQNSQSQAACSSCQAIPASRKPRAAACQVVRFPPPVPRHAPPALQESQRAHTGCVKCLAGTYAAAGSASCSSCAAGTYSGAQASSCTACAAGKYQGSTGQGSCVSCPAGKIASNTGRTACVHCAKGKYSQTTTTCTACQPARPMAPTA